MSIFEVRSTPTFRSLKKRGRSYMRALIRELSGTEPRHDITTSDQLAREVLRLLGELP